MSHLEEPIFQLSGEPIAILDHAGVITRANDAWMSAFGYSPDALLRRSVAELASPPEVEHVRGWLARIASAGEPIGLRTVLRNAAGGVVSVLMRAAAAADGERAYLFVRREIPTVAAQLEALGKVLTDTVLFTDLQDRLVGVNRSIPGFAADQFLGVPALRLLPPEHAAVVGAQFEQVRAGEIVSHRASLDRLDGEGIATFETRMGPVMENGRVVGGVLVTREISAQLAAEAARERAEQQTREHLVQLERSNRELERFASVASHDLQEPLRKIQAFGDRLRQKYEALLPEPGRDYLARMQDAAKRMQDLINDLLAFSRLTTKEQRLAPVNLNRALASVLSDLEVRIEENAATIDAGDLPTIEADPLHVRQLLQNLIGNALKFRRPDVAPVVTIRATELPTATRGGPRWEISVADNGIGVDPKYHERIFGIFERLHSRGRYEGTGVGLAVCKKICEQLSGSIRIDSDGERGSAFIVELPARQERGKVSA